MKDKISIFWYRRDLRIEDNTALFYALSGDLPVLPIFIFDKNILGKLENKSDARVQFIRNCLVAINKQFVAHGSSLKVFYSTPVEAFNNLLETYEIKEVFTNRDYEPYAFQRDEEIKQLLEKKNAKLLTFKDQVIFEYDEITTDSGDPYKVFTPFKNKWIAKFKDLNHGNFTSEKKLGSLYKIAEQPIPTLAAMGFEESPISIPAIDFNESLIKKYDQIRNFPAIKGTTRMGIHLRFGTVSVRKAAYIAIELNETWLNELIWREFYMMVLANNPHVVEKAFKPQYDRVPWRNSPEDFQKWCDGKTGYPIVDAGMRELNTTGYMHNRVRMITASFLTKHLLIDWRWGEAYFAAKLLDFELASNNGGWQWAAGTGTDAQPYFRIFNPASQTEKFDKNMEYIKKWVPEISTNQYPKPMVDHKMARERALETYKKAVNT